MDFIRLAISRVTSKVIMTSLSVNEYQGKQTVVQTKSSLSFLDIDSKSPLRSTFAQYHFPVTQTYLN